MAYVAAGRPRLTEEQQAAAAGSRRSRRPEVDVHARRRGGIRSTTTRRARERGALARLGLRHDDAAVRVFVVLFAISSVNISKVKVAQQVAAGGVLRPGAQRRRGDHGDAATQSHAEKPAPTPPLPAMSPAQALEARMSAVRTSPRRRRGSRGRREGGQDFQALKRRIDELVQEAGLAARSRRPSSPRGLVVRLLTDKLVFDSGSAVHQPGRLPARSTRSATCCATEARAPVRRRGPHRRPADHELRSTRPTGSCPAPAPRRSSSASCPTAWSRGARRSAATRRQHPVDYATRLPRGRAQKPPGRDHPRPGCMEQPSRMEATRNP